MKMLSPTFIDAWKLAKKILAQSPELGQLGLVDTEAEQLTLEALKPQRINRVDFFFRLKDTYPLSAYEKLKKWCEARVLGKPLQYLTGTQYFLRHCYQVKSGVFIPRPETEGLIEEVKKKIATPQKGLEFGIGSGVLSIELLSHFKNLTMWASEISEQAVEIASMNAAQILGESRNALKILKSNAPYQVLEIFPNFLKKKIDFIISNPPYLIPSDPIAQDVLSHEPFEALFAPLEEPLYFYQKIIDQSLQWLKPGGYLFLELPHQRASQIVSLCSASRWKVELISDLSQRERILVAHW